MGLSMRRRKPMVHAGLGNHCIGDSQAQARNKGTHQAAGQSQPFAVQVRTLSAPSLLAIHSAVPVKTLIPVKTLKYLLYYSSCVVLSFNKLSGPEIMQRALYGRSTRDRRRRIDLTVKSCVLAVFGIASWTASNGRSERYSFPGWQRLQRD